MPYCNPNTQLAPAPDGVLPLAPWLEVFDLVALVADAWGENPAELDAERLAQANRYLLAASRITARHINLLAQDNPK